MEDGGGGSLAKKPATLLLRQGPGGPPPRPDLDPKLYLKVDGESSGLTYINRLISFTQGPWVSVSPFVTVWTLTKSLTSLLVHAFRSVYG